MVCVNNEKLKTGDGINLITLLRSTSENKNSLLNDRQRVLVSSIHTTILSGLL